MKFHRQYHHLKDSNFDVAKIDDYYMFSVMIFFPCCKTFCVHFISQNPFSENLFIFEADLIQSAFSSWKHLQKSKVFFE